MQMTRPDSQTLRHGIHAIGDTLSDGIGRSASDLVEVVAGLAENAPIRRSRPMRPSMPRPSMLVRALIVGLVTAAVVGILAALWTRNERLSTLRRQEDERELELDAAALDRASDEGMTPTADDAAEADIVGIPIVDESTVSETVSTVA
jgi:hypothetical protein